MNFLGIFVYVFLAFIRPNSIVNKKQREVKLVLLKCILSSKRISNKLKRSISNLTVRIFCRFYPLFFLLLLVRSWLIFFLHFSYNDVYFVTVMVDCQGRQKRSFSFLLHLSFKHETSGWSDLIFTYANTPA